MKVCGYGKYVQRRARGQMCLSSAHYELQAVNFFTQFCNRVYKRLINIIILNSEHIAVLICTLALVATARPRTIWGIS